MAASIRNVAIVALMSVAWSVLAADPLGRAGENELTPAVASTKALNLIRQTKELVEQESASIQIVGRALTKAEKKRLTQLAAAERDLQHAEDAVAKGHIDPKHLDVIQKHFLAPQSKRTAEEEKKRQAIPAVRLIRQAILEIENDANKIKIVGRKQSPDEKQRLHVLATATTYLQDAENQIVGKSRLATLPIELKRPAGKQLFFATLDGTLRRSPNAFQATLPHLEASHILWRLVLPEDDRLASRVANYMDRPVRVSGHVRILTNQKNKDGSRGTGYQMQVTSIEFSGTELVGVTSPDGNLLLVGHENGQLNMFNAKTGKLKEKIYVGLKPERFRPSAVSWLPTGLFSPTGDSLVTQRGNEAIELRSPPTGQVKRLVGKVNGRAYMRIGKFSRDGKFLLAHQIVSKGPEAHPPLVFEMHEGNEVFSVPPSPRGHNRTLEFSADGSKLFVTNTDGETKSYKLGQEN